MKSEIITELTSQKGVLSAGCLAAVSAAINWLDLVNDVLGFFAVASSIVLTWVFIIKHSRELNTKNRRKDDV